MYKNQGIKILFLIKYECVMSNSNKKLRFWPLSFKTMQLCPLRAYSTHIQALSYSRLYIPRNKP